MAVTVGFFDGVHMGHRKVLRTLQEIEPDPIVVTFWPHPRVVLQQDARDFNLLSSMPEKTALIQSQGIRDIRCLPFSREFATKTAEQFLREDIIGELGCRHLVLGYDNRLGRDSLSSQNAIDLCGRLGMEATVVEPFFVEDVPVSSTRIRNSLLDGDVALAGRMLGYRYSLDGIVVPGNRLGRTLGFPTANIRLTFPLKVVPANGVYATEILIGDNRYRGMTNIGVRPTLGDGGERLIETNIFDFDEDIYGCEIKLSFIARVRDEKKFTSLEQLKEQLEIDRHRCYGFN